MIDEPVTLSRTRQTGEQGTGSWEFIPFPIPGSLLPAHQFSDRVIDHTHVDIPLPFDKLSRVALCAVQVGWKEARATLPSGSELT